MREGSERFRFALADEHHALDRFRARAGRLPGAVVADQAFLEIEQREQAVQRVAREL